MSGGVDSSVAAYIMKQRGCDCIGVTMKLFDNEDIGMGSDKTCCSLADTQDARNVACSMDMPFYVLNFAEDFKKQVIDRFVSAYQKGATPNPCIDCNRYMKFEKLLDRAEQLGLDCIVTGHYARIEYSDDRYLLKKAADTTKDQSYVLYSMTQRQLSRTVFPLGELCKSEVRRIAAEQGFINADKGDSQDICFVRDGDYAGFIENYTNTECQSGDFVDTHGNILGRHKGIIRYTVGQRRGIGLSFDSPMYVLSKCTDNNTVTLCQGDELYKKSFDADGFNWIAISAADAPMRTKAKIRYNQVEQWATVTPTGEDTVHVEFDQPQRAIAKGQAVVLYDGDIVVGGGVIK